MKKCRFTISLVAAAFVIAGAGVRIAFASDSSGSTPIPPGPPKQGPGSTQYVCSSKKMWMSGEGDRQYWVFEPAGPTSAPVIIFNHGWSAMEPGPYEGWVDHLVRRGNIVIYPRYQASLSTKADVFVESAAAATKDALARLSSEPGHVRPQLDKLATVGHSAGGMVAAGLAAVGQSRGLPQMKAVMCVEPGKSWGPPRLVIPLADMSKIPASTLLLTVAGEHDMVARDIDARKIYDEARSIPKANKNFVMLLTDDHGSPALTASHFCPISPIVGGSAPGGEKLRRLQSASADGSGLGAAGGQFGRNFRSAYFQRQIERLRSRQPGLFEERSDAPQPAANAVNALDYYGLWKLFDGLTDAAWYGKNRRYALGNTPEMRYMGKWSDGVPVKEIKVVQ